MEALGAVVERVRPVSISHKDHFVNIARRRAQLVDLNVTDLCTSSGKNAGVISCKEESACPGLSNLSMWHKDNSQGGYFADQFENLANFRAHYEGTGPEIWAQTGGKLHAFVAAAGTGGTIAGVSRFLKV